MEILLANPRGFCAGVDRAIEMVEQALDFFGAPIYVWHEIVHNRLVLNTLKDKGAVFIEHFSQIPEHATVIFSAHGVSQTVRQHVQTHSLKVFDATCPLVTKVHMEVTRYSRLGYECVLIGHTGHPEVEGTMGQYDNTSGGIYLVENEADVAKLLIKNPQKLAYVTQTTLSVDDTARIIDALRKKFPAIQGPRKEDICYATQNRQESVKQLATQCDVVIVVGSVNSSNSNRLCELAQQYCPAYLIDDPEALQAEWVENIQCIGVTAGASAPETLVQQIVARLEHWKGTQAKELPGREETITFALPKELRGQE